MGHARCSRAASKEIQMPLVEFELSDGIMLIRMNRPERLNALNAEMREALAQAWTEFHTSKEAEVCIYTGTGRGFCVGEDMRESVERGAAGRTPTSIENPYESGKIEKPVIAAV